MNQLKNVRENQSLQNRTGSTEVNGELHLRLLGSCFIKLFLSIQIEAEWAASAEQVVTEK